MADAQVILWDDPFSSVDVLLERKILQALRSRVKEKTFVLTSHRLTTVKSCDRTVLLDPKTGIKAHGGPVPEGALFDFFREQVHGAPAT